MDITKAYPSRWLKASDIPEQGLILTMSSVTMESIGTDGDQEKPALHFRDYEKALTLNTTNADTLKDLYGPETDAWGGQKVVLFIDHNVMYKGKKIDGVRVQAVVAQAAIAATPVYADQPVFPDETMQNIAGHLSDAAIIDKATDIVDPKGSMIDAFKAARDVAIKAGLVEAEVARFRVNGRSTNAQVYMAALSLLMAADALSAPAF